jgi:hypothetical protein
MAWRLAALMASLALAASPARGRADSSIQCDGGIVSVGDAKVDLLGKCGAPVLVDQRTEKRHTPEGGHALVSVEQWTYNFGPNRFLQFVTLVDGKVARVDRGGYGYPPEALEPRPPGRARCETSQPRVGDSKVDLLAKCGEPILRETRLETRPGLAGPVSVQVDVWTLDFGPQSFVQFVVFENGRVVRIDRGSYGYAR